MSTATRMNVALTPSRGMRRTQRRVGALLCLFVLGACATAAENGSKTKHVIEIRDFKFFPEKVTVKVGDTVTWKNLDAVPHTATATDRRWDSQLLANDAEWSLTISNSSGGEYFCIYHPSMKGLIIVQR